MPKTLVTHNARFHPDDIFACATLQLLFPSINIIRSRDPILAERADIVVDTGSMYDPDRLRFDHHQAGGAGVRANKIPYASFGLVWKKFGKDLCGSQEVADMIDAKVVQPIDAMDNGIDLYTPKIPGVYPYIFQSVIISFGITWKESEDLLDTHFMELVQFMKKVLAREIKRATDIHEAAGLVRDAYERAPNKKIIELDRNYPWDEVLAGFPEPLYVVRKNSQNTDWKVEAVRDSIYSYEMRKMMPESWAGKRDEELAQVTGVPDAVFCHNARFMAMAKSREGALKLAQIAVEA